MKIEEFIKERKKRDEINEFDLDKKMENLHQFVDYVFEYFALYINVDELTQATIELDTKTMKYQKQLEDYNLDTQSWLIKVFREENVQIIRSLKNRLHEDILFGLYYNAKGWRKSSFNLYANLIKKYQFLEKYTNELYDFVVDESILINKNYYNSLSEEAKVMLPDKICSWVEKVGKNYHVDIMNWVENYLDVFYDKSNLWPKSRQIKGEFILDYDVRPKNNRFDIEGLYKELGEIEYIRGKKKYLETIMMYHWINYVDNQFSEFYDDFLKEKGF